MYYVINCEVTSCNSHIAQDKTNQTMKFDQLIEFNNRNFFLENCTKKVVEKLVLNPFLRNRYWQYLCINNLKCYTVCFYRVFKSRTTKTSLPFTSYKTFPKITNLKLILELNLELISLSCFVNGFLKKKISHVLFY